MADILFEMKVEEVQASPAPPKPPDPTPASCIINEPDEKAGDGKQRYDWGGRYEALHI